MHSILSGSIRRKLLSFVLMTAILPGAIYTFVTWQSSTDALRQSIGLSFMQAAKANAQQISTTLESRITDAELFSRELAREVDESDLSIKASTAEGPNKHLIEHLSFFGVTRRGRYSRFLVTDIRGKVVGADPVNGAPTDLSDQTWWRRAMNSAPNRAFVGNLHRDKKTGKHSIYIAMAMFSQDRSREAATAAQTGSKPAGLFVLEATLDSLLKGATRQRIGKTGHVDIFDSQQNLILGTGKIIREKIPKALFSQLAQAKPTWKVARDEHGQLSLIGVSPISFSKNFESDIFNSERKWFVMIPQGLVDAYAPLINLMIKIFVLGWLSVAIIFVIGYYRSGQIVGPLRELSLGAREIGRGNLDFHVDLTTGDEMQDLGDDFNRMAVALKASQQRLRTANDQLEHASKLKSEFLANMSHELRTPLNSIIGFAEVMADQLFGPLNPKQQKYMSNVHTSGLHLLQLINDILDLSKIEAGKLELNYHEFVAAEVLTETCAAVKMLAEKKELKLTLDIDPELETIAADEGKFKQIMYNLLSNAVKFTPKQGRILVEAKNKRGLAVISVTDSGIGISKKDQEMIFEQFRQVSGSDAREFEGTGLGLALTKKLIELHGGRISILSELGKGSKFTFTIPVDMPDTLVAASEVTRVCRLPLSVDELAARVIQSSIAPGVPAPKSGRPTILIVEDDPKAAELLSIYITDADYDAIVTADAEEAIKLARDLQPFAITLDVMLPKKDGWQVLQELKASPLTKDIPVIICSMIDDRQLGISLGAVGHLTKPIMKNELVQLISRCRENSRAEKPYVILVVDDDPNAVDLLTAALEPEGFGVLKAYGGEEAITKATAYRPDLMVLDLMMPKVSGFDVVRALNENEHGRNLPIIVLTAKDLTSEDRRELNNHIERVMQKAQFKREDLVNEIRKIERLDPHKAMLIDVETGLFNYRFFKKRLKEEELRAQRYRRAFSVMLIDIANVKKVRHKTTGGNGGSVLRDVARILEQNIRGADPIARYTDAQFAIILPETNRNSAVAVSKKITGILNGYEALSGSDPEPAKLEVVVSVAAFFEDAEESQALIDKIEREVAAAAAPAGEVLNKGDQ